MGWKLGRRISFSPLISDTVAGVVALSTLLPSFFPELCIPPNWRVSSLRQAEVTICTMIPLKDIAPAAANNINTKFILLDKGKKTMEGQNMTCLTLVADETASVHFQLWGDECDAFQPGDIILLTNGIFSYNRKNLVLRAGKRGRVEKVGEFTVAYVETPNMSEIRWVADPQNSKKFVQETLV